MSNVSNSVCLPIKINAANQMRSENQRETEMDHVISLARRDRAETVTLPLARLDTKKTGPPSGMIGCTALH